MIDSGGSWKAKGVTGPDLPAPWEEESLRRADFGAVADSLVYL